ncbi:Nascent polypeptide-associated complex subunit alpha, partial [Fragariocoptes setiger]
MQPVPEVGKASDITAAGGDSKQTRSEKKARKVILKLGLKQVTGVNRVAIRKSKNILFVINNPDVYKSQDTYIIFGEAKIEDLSHKAQLAAAEKFKTDPSSVMRNVMPEGPTGAANADRIRDDSDGEDIDTTGIDSKDIDLVMSQANCRRKAAVKALQKHNSDVVDAIMELTL